MSSYLNAYQIATLQEMGICVWSKQADIQDKSAHANSSLSADKQGGNNPLAPSPVSRPVSQVSSQDRIAQLRSVLGTDDKKPATKAEPVVQKPATQPTEQAIDKASMGALASDIQQALAMFACAPEKWVTGEHITVNKQTLTLPQGGSQLSAAEKRELWRQLCQALS